MCRRHHNTNTAPRYADSSVRLSRGSDDAVIDVEATSGAEKKFRKQMVLLQRRVQNDDESIPHLLEIHSNCKWDSKR